MIFKPADGGGETNRSVNRLNEINRSLVLSCGSGICMYVYL